MHTPYPRLRATDGHMEVAAECWGKPCTSPAGLMNATHKGVSNYADMAMFGADIEPVVDAVTYIHCTGPSESALGITICNREVFCSIIPAETHGTD